MRGTICATLGSQGFGPTSLKMPAIVHGKVPELKRNNRSAYNFEVNGNLVEWCRAHVRIRENGVRCRYDLEELEIPSRAHL